jgi:hypothetical protein
MTKKITDIFELYSFIIYLYGYEYFYCYIFNQPLVKGLLINISFNIFSSCVFNMNIIKFLSHTYWLNNLNNISMPQLLSSIINITTGSGYFTDNVLINIPINIFLNQLISKMYTNEISYSKNLRYLLIFIFLIKDII